MGPRTKNANYGKGASPPREDVESEEEETNSEEDVESEEKSNNEDVESEEEETTEANTKGKDGEKDGEDGESSEEEEESEKENASEANTKDKDGEDRENHEEEEETDSEDETEPLQPLSMHLSSSYYNNTIKFTTRCYVTEAISVIEEVLNEDEKNWFYNHPQFRHLFHMPKDTNHKTMGMWLLLLRTARIKKEKEVWFVVNGVSVCYSLREHGLISGLCCHDYPKGYDKKGDLKFVKKHFKEKKVTVVEVEKKLRSMKKGGEERLKMAVLFFLGAVMKGTLKGGIKGKGAEQATPIPKFFQKVAPELEFCKSFPWGRFTFFDTLKDIERMMKLFKGAAKPNFIFPSFIIPLEIMAFEAIPCLMEKFREVITEADSGCPRMCKSKFQHSSMRGFSIHEINDALGKTKEIHSVLLPTQDEKQLMSEIMNDHDEDDHIDMIVDGWKKRISDGKSVFFEEYYLNDIKSREQKEDAQENVVQPNVVAEENVVEPNVAVSEYVTVGDLLELKKWMENRFSELNNSIDAQNKRLDRVELVVKELNLGEMNAGNVAEMNDGNLGERNDGNWGEMNDGNLGERNDGNWGEMHVWREPPNVIAMPFSSNISDVGIDVLASAAVEQVIQEEVEDNVVASEMVVEKVIVEEEGGNVVTSEMVDAGEREEPVVEKDVEAKGTESVEKGSEKDVEKVAKKRRKRTYSELQKPPFQKVTTRQDEKRSKK